MGRLMLVLFLVVAPMALIYHAEAIQKSYTMNISKNGKDYLERIQVDTKKGTESSQVREAKSGKSAGESIIDFNRKLTMTLLPEANACFLSDSTQNAPRPAELIQVLKLMSAYTSVKMNPQITATYKAIGKLDDRSKLSQEMRDLCANLTIYRVVKQNGTGDQKSDSGDADPAEVPVGEGSKQRRGLCRYLCHTFCWYKCGWGGCSRVCKKICSWIC